MHKRLSLIALAVVSVVLIAACGGDDDSTSASTDAAAGDGGGSPEGKSAVLVTFGDDTPWGAEANKLIEEGLEAEGIEWKAILKSPNDPAQQSQQMNQAIGLDPDLIIVAPADSNAIVPSVQKADAAGIPVVVFNSPVAPEGEDAVTTTVQADNEALGRAAGETLVAGLEEAGVEEGNIIHITGTNSMAIVQDRIKAFDEVLADTNYTVVEQEDANWDPGATAEIATSLFAKYAGEGGIQGAYGTADYMSLAIVSAAEQDGQSVGTAPGDLVVVGSNCTGPGVESVIDGVLAGDATQAPAEQVAVLNDTVVQFLSGESVEKVVYVPVEKITPENAQDYLDACSY